MTIIHPITLLVLLSSSAFAHSVDGFDYPVDDGDVTESHDGDGYYNALDWTDYNSSVGAYHCGEDWNGEGYGSTDYGDDVYATADGIVVDATNYGGSWGNVILIEHYIDGASDTNYETITSQYGHLSVIDVAAGDWVYRGDKIGEIGDADGYYKGSAHLHFELRWDETMAGNDGGYSCTSTTTGTIDPSDFIDDHRTWSSANGDWSYCTEDSPCFEGQGDCDSDAECGDGLSCVLDVGADYGLDSGVDICEYTASSAGDWDYCSEDAPCSEGEGDCDTDAECGAGLSCSINVGASYGWDADVDVCEAAASPGDWDYCSASNPCSEGEGDCDTNADCASGLSCSHNVGSNYGWNSILDVCEDTSAPGDWDYCSPSSPCGAGEGDCDTNTDCDSGLSCSFNVGADYGWASGMDVCE
jgi:hypothetical protein